MDASYRKIRKKGRSFLADEIRIITFPSVWHAFRAEKILKAAGVPCDLIPVPRELSSSCQGLAAKVTDSVLDKVLELLDAQQVQIEKRGVKVNKA
jgi:hypothetical protein